MPANVFSPGGSAEFLSTLLLQSHRSTLSVASPARSPFPAPFYEYKIQRDKA